MEKSGFRLRAIMNTPTSKPKGLSAQLPMTWRAWPHVIRRSNCEAMARRREFNEAMRRRVREVAAFRSLPMRRSSRR